MMQRRQLIRSIILVLTLVLIAGTFASADEYESAFQTVETALDELERKVRSGDFTVSDFEQVEEVFDDAFSGLYPVPERFDERFDGVDDRYIAIDIYAGERGNNQAVIYLKEVETTVESWEQESDNPYSPTQEEVERLYEELDESGYETNLVFGDQQYDWIDDLYDRLDVLWENALPEVGVDYLREYENFAERASRSPEDQSIRSTYKPLSGFANRREDLLDEEPLRWSDRFEEELYRIEGLIADSLTEILRGRLPELEQFAQTGEFTYRDTFWIEEWRVGAEHLMDYSSYADKDVGASFADLLERTVLQGNSAAEVFVENIERQTDAVLEQTDVTGEDWARLEEITSEIANLLQRMTEHIESRGEANPDFEYVLSPAQIQRLVAVNQKIIQARFNRSE